MIAPIKHAQEQLHAQDGNLNAGFLCHDCGEATELVQYCRIGLACFGQRERQTGSSVSFGNPSDLDMCIQAHKDCRKADEAVHRGHKLRHLGHLDALRDVDARNGTCRDQNQRQ